ncbi:MAG: hypothetical protein AAGI22_08265 [Planctomycetota bacterium]
MGLRSGSSPPGGGGVLGLVLVPLALSGCAARETIPEIEPPTDVHVSHPVDEVRLEGACDSIVELQHPSRGGTQVTGFAVSDRHLLTTRWIIESWRRGDESLALRIDGVLTVARVAARGWSEDPHGHWAVLECPGHSFDAVTPIHEPALDPEWAPAPGTEVVFVRPASVPAEGVAFEVVRAGEGRWTALGGTGTETGLLGAPAMVWNATASRLEAIGLFTGSRRVTQLDPPATRVDGTPHSGRDEFVVGTTYSIERLPAAALALHGN